MNIRIAMVACLDERHSVHTATFKRAVALFTKFWKEGTNNSDEVEILIKLFDDNADSITAAQVATDIIEWHPHAVIGHFASAAAAVAAPIYAAANIPLLLPAATVRHLTRSATTYRICDHDDTYIQAINQFCQRHNLRLDEIKHDGSIHGQRIAYELQHQVLVSDQAKSCVLFSGTCHNSIEFLAKLGSNARTLLLTDDALAPEIIVPAQAYGNDVFIIGLAPKPQGQFAEQLRKAYQSTYRTQPGSYFWETIAAMQVVVEACGKSLQEKIWDTVLGKIDFDNEREFSPVNFAAYRVTSVGGFEEYKI